MRKGIEQSRNSSLQRVFSDYRSSFRRQNQRDFSTDYTFPSNSERSEVEDNISSLQNAIPILLSHSCDSEEKEAQISDYTQRVLAALRQVLPDLNSVHRSGPETVFLKALNSAF